MGLSEYRKKRDFQKTPEPGRDARSAPARRVFVVQKHGSRHTHYDLRLRVGDVLKSWAVPRGPSLDPNEKRLAIETEDHPLAYASFEGVIPEGEYGAGAMMIWDHGEWAPETDVRAALEEGMLKFRLEGTRLKGRWMLVRTKPDRWEGKKPAWLLVKERDRDAVAGVGAETYATSVATGRTMEEIEAGAPARVADAPADIRPSAASLPNARRAPIPAKLRPQLATPSPRVPDGPDWFHEVKFDGYRLLMFRKDDEVRILSRAGLNWTDRLQDLADAVRDRLRVDAVIDGEAVILDTRGVSDFQALQNAINNKRARSVVYFAFDLPWCDGYDLAKTPLEHRRRLLAELIGPRQEGRLRLSEYIEGNGPLALERIREHGLEGLVSKRRDSIYSHTRTSDWLKVKCFNQQEFVIGGFTMPEGAREQFGALLLGVYDDKGSLRFAGRVGTGFSAETLKRLGTQLRERVQAKPAFANPPTGPEARGVTWVRPDLVAQIQFRDWSADAIARHTSFRGLRDDRDPRTVVREAPGVVAAPEPSAPAAPKPRKASARSRTRATPPAPATAAAPGGSRVRLTNPERIVYPDRGAGYELTKQQVAAYYEAVGDHILPHLVKRPLSVLRCPDGEGAKPFFQKHPAPGMPAPIRAVDVRDDDGTVERHLMIEDLDGMLGLVQMSVLEFHPWGSHPGSMDEPDRVIFDLDPGPDVSWRHVVEGALLLRDALAQVGMTSFARTSGGKGIHVLIPVKRGASWPQVTAFSKAVADTMVRMAPKRFVATSALDARRGRIYVDYLRNVRGATAIAPYSTRARPGAPIALPVGWDELPGLAGANTFSPQSVERRLASGAPDPWATFEASAVEIPTIQ